MRSLKVFSLACILFVFSYSQLKAQITSSKIDSLNLKEQAETMIEAFFKKDYKTFISFTYPKVVSMMGGEEKMSSFLQKGVEQMNNEGFTFDSCSIGGIQQIVKAGEEIHALIPQRLTLKSNKGILTINSYLLAISTTGVKWYFVDAGNLAAQEVKAVFPNFNPI